MKPRVFRRRLAIEATLAVAAGLLAVRLLPTGRITAWAARPPRRIHRFADPDWPHHIAAAVNRTAERLRPANPCLPCALAAQFMLRRRGIASMLCLGVRLDEGSLSAHAWVEIDGRIVVGETDRPFTRLAGYGGIQQVKAPS